MQGRQSTVPKSIAHNIESWTVERGRLYIPQPWLGTSYETTS